MRIESFEALITTRREIEFEYQKKNYSITYFSKDGVSYISYCEEFTDPIEVKSIGELENIKIQGIPLICVVQLVPEKDFIIY